MIKMLHAKGIAL